MNGVSVAGGAQTQRGPSGLSQESSGQEKRRSAGGATLRRIANTPTRVAALLLLSTAVLSALFAPLVAPYDPLEIDIANRLIGPTIEHPLGTDEIGRDLLSNILYASRISLLVGLGASLFAIAIAVPLGMLSGLRGGWADVVIMRFTDGMLAIPSLLLALALVTSLGASMRTLIVALGVTLTPGVIRIIRAESLGERGKDYVLSARALGSSDVRILFRHILPNTFSIILVQATISITLAILLEAFMSYIGLGIQPPRASLGTLISAGYGYVGLSFWYVTFPGLYIFLLIWTLNILGDAMRDALDPRLRGLSVAGRR